MPRDCGCETILNNSCDDSPIEITTVECTNAVSCETTNWTKCIKYEGSDLGCAVVSGGISTFSFSGTPEDSGTYTTTNLTPTGGSGTGAKFTVSDTGTGVYTVTVTTAGTGYRVGDTLTISGPTINGGFTVLSNITITVVTLSNTVTTSTTEISNGDTLTAIIQNLNSRICELTPDFQNYALFTYGCLRVGGNLESTGTAITTAEEFAEATAAALCSLNTRLKLVEVTGVTNPYIGTLIGDETLAETLDAVIDYAGSIEDSIGFPLSITAGCFTTAPSTSSLEDWIQWIVTNTCGINTTLTSSISGATTKINNINTYLQGSTSPSYPITYDISALGGSATATVHGVLGELITETTALKTAVAALPDLDAITLAWDTCFSSSPYSYTGTAQDLQTQLERILNVISREKITFSADFTVTDSSCGKSVELASGGGWAFTCSSLGSCSITDLGDVNSTAPGSGDVGKVYKWNNSAGEFQLVALDDFTNIGVVDKSGSYSGASLGFYFSAPSVTAPAKKSYEVGFVEQAWSAVTSFQPDYGTTVANPLMVKKTWDGNIVFKGKLLSISSPSSNALNVPTGTALFTIPTGYFPSASVTKLDMNVSYITISPSDTPITLAGYITINGSTGLVTFFCNDGDATATAAAITALGNSDAHDFTFDGKVVFQ